MNESPAPEAATVESLMAQVADEFLERLDRGERPEVEQYAARYPQVAGFIRQMFPALELMRQTPFDPATGGDAAAPAGPGGGCLGDFRILREVGRGGMGIVYEAEQVSLRRRVALKVLPFAATLDARQLQRFRNEAQAAAHLHHTNIVPVYAVGCERGVHYYAMQFIDGQTLAAMIAELRRQAGRDGGAPPGSAAPAVALASEMASGRWAPWKQGAAEGPATDPYPPSPESPGTATADTRPQPAAASTERSARDPGYFRTVAHLGIQAAEALEHAHQLGVVHRDVKPGNLLVDGRGHLWVTDFGLAHCQSQAGLTMTGDLIGTLRYMSPEQALARRAVIDHRTDVYSLGASLYELLALEPAFPGSDRQELLRQIAFEEPRPPRRLNKAVPAELEIIVTKAMQKWPPDRYGTAQELADDLRRFLEDKPIRARRPTLVQHLRRWLRRHTPAVVIGLVAAALLLLGTVAALVVSNRAIDRAREEATRQRDDAQAQRQLARRAVDKMYTQVAEKWLAQQPGLEPLQREFLEEALHFYQGFAEERSTDPELRLEAGDAYRRVGEIQERVGDTAGATEALNRASAVLEQLVADFPHEPRYRMTLAHSQCSLGCLLTRLGRPREAEAQLQKSLLLREELVAGSPDIGDYRLELSFSESALANVQLTEGRGREAVETFGRAVSLLRDLPADRASTVECRLHLAGCRRDLGWALLTDGRPQEAVESVRQALALLEKVFGDSPNDPRVRHELAWTLIWLGRYLPGSRSQEAETDLRRALALEEKLAADFPAVPEYTRVAVICRERLGGLLSASGRVGEGEACFREAEEFSRKGLAMAEKLATRSPAVAEYTLAEAVCQRDLARLLKNSGRAREAEDCLREAQRLYERLVAGPPPAPPSYWQELLETRHQMEGPLLANGRLPEAEANRRTSLALAERLAKEFPSVHLFRGFVALNYQYLGSLLREAGRPEEAEKAHRKALAIASELAAAYPATAFRGRDYGFLVADCQNDLADLFLTGPVAPYGDPAEAVALTRRAVGRHPENGAFWNTLGTAYYRAGNWEAATAALEKAVQLHNGGDYGDWFFLVMARWRLGHKEEARKWYNQAVAWGEEHKPELDRDELEGARFRRFRAEAAELLGLEKPPRALGQATATRGLTPK